MSKTTSTLIAFVVAALALYLLSLVFWSRFKHDDFASECSQGADIARVELVGGYTGLSGERGSPYYLRIPVFDGGTMRLEHPVLVEADDRHPVALTAIKRGEIEGVSVGEVVTVWYTPDLDLDYVDHQFEARLVSPEGGTRKIACTLKAHPMVEWRSPVWDALMSV